MNGTVRVFTCGNEAFSRSPVSCPRADRFSGSTSHGHRRQDNGPPWRLPPAPPAAVTWRSSWSNNHMNLVICHYSFYLRSTLTPREGRRSRCLHWSSSSFTCVDLNGFCNKILKEHSDTVIEEIKFFFSYRESSMQQAYVCNYHTLVFCKPDQSGNSQMLLMKTLN